MRENKLADLSMDFSVDIINLVKHLKANHGSIIANQIDRSGKFHNDLEVIISHSPQVDISRFLAPLPLLYY